VFACLSFNPSAHQEAGPPVMEAVSSRYQCRVQGVEKAAGIHVQQNWIEADPVSGRAEIIDDPRGCGGDFVAILHVSQEDDTIARGGVLTVKFLNFAFTFLKDLIDYDYIQHGVVVKEKAVNQGRPSKRRNHPLAYQYGVEGLSTHSRPFASSKILTKIAAVIRPELLELAALPGQTKPPDAVKPFDTFRITRAEPFQFHAGKKLKDEDKDHEPVDCKSNNKGCIQVFESREYRHFFRFFVKPKQARAQKSQDYKMRENLLNPTPAAHG